MIIGYDGKRAVFDHTALGNYSRLTVDAMARFYPENTYRLYTPSVKSNPQLREALAHKNVRLVPSDKALGIWRSPLWRTFGMGTQMVADGCQLIHGLTGELPQNVARVGVPSVVTVNDVIFRRYPEYYSAADQRIRDYKVGHAVREATRVLATSKCTARDIENIYGIPAEKIDVVYQACHPQFRREVSEEDMARVKERYGIRRPYIICVGAVEHRKNQMMAVRGLRFVPDEFDLLIVGRRTGYAKEIDRYARTYHLSERVKFIENARFEDLPALYAGAFCSSYTSFYDGFGMPIVESLSVGTPVIISSGSCHEELAGPSAPVVRPDDINEWVYVVKEMCNYPARRIRIEQEGREYVARFSEEAMARGTMECYLKAERDFTRR